MPPKVEKQATNVVQIDSSDDEDGARIGATKTNNASSTELSLQSDPRFRNSRATTSSLPSHENLQCRSFWKAGAYVVGPTSKPNPAQGITGLLEHARVHPKFLHSNATSHKWAFGAIAELLDNAVDEIHNGATFVKVDKINIMKDNSPALLFQDDGGGMDPECIRKCMSLGYSSKKSNTTIGQYGNGFKTSTMRLGADVIVFSRSTRGSKATQSVGLLSYTFLQKTGQDDVLVPMIDFDISGNWAEPIIYGSQDDWSSNLKTITEWSPFESKEDLLLQFEEIGQHGTKIIIYNLWLNDEGIYELSFDDDDEDVRLIDEDNHSGTKKHKRVVELQSHISYRIRYSLRAYASILYLRKFKNFKIILRGKPVEQFNIADELKHREVVTYKPHTEKEVVAVETTIGFVKEAPSLGIYGFNVYHKNRLIRPFWKVVAGDTARGHGVVGVLEANFIEPAHDKQDFERSSVFIRLETRLKQMLMSYWKSHCHLIGHQPQGSSARDVPKELIVQSNVRHRQKRSSNCLDTLEEIHLDQPFSLPLNVTQNLTNGQSETVLPAAQPSIELATESVNEVTSGDDPVFESVDQICSDNLELFGRCERLVRKEAELKQTIEDLEEKLEEAKRLQAELSECLENSGMGKIIKLQSRKVS